MNDPIFVFDPYAVHAMIDFETLGLKPTSMILSVGVVVFTLKDGIDGKFYFEFNALSQYESRTVESSTIEFWENKPNRPNGIANLTDGIGQLNSFLLNCNIDYLWANGTDFDIPLYYSTTAPANRPFKYNSVRDYRTVASLYPEIIRPNNPDSHNALSDANTQAAHLIEILKHHASKAPIFP